MAGPPMLCQKHEELSCSSEDRQYSSSCVCQQDGRCNFERSLPVSTRDVELVHRPSYNHLSGTSTRFAESSSGQGIEVQGGLIRMGPRQSYLQSVDGQKRPLHSRPLCLPSLCEASYLLQLEIGSRGDSSKCPVPALGDINRLCYHPVTSATIARWLKQVLREAGVSDEFSAHSTRATAVSIAFDKGVSVSDIMKTADWSSESVFKKFYYKPSLSSVNSNRFAHAVLSHHD